jgi:hypothetical protein
MSDDPFTANAEQVGHELDEATKKFGEAVAWEAGKAAVGLARDVGSLAEDAVEAVGDLF